MLFKPFALESDFLKQASPEGEHLGIAQSLSQNERVEQAYSDFESQVTVLRKNQYLHQLFDRDALLFFTLAQKYLRELLPILYTPTVGEVVKTFHSTRSSTRGLYICLEDQDHISSLLSPYPKDSISIAVLTDGERILGLGDQGVGGIEVCIAKAMMYVLCGHIPPYRLLPIYLDVGTNNPALLSDPAYAGHRETRATGKAYDVFIDKVITALCKKFPGIYLHWEDINHSNAKGILDKYGGRYCVFNDDMQGTGIVTLASVLTATKITQTPLTEQRVVIVGGGTAGLGIADQLSEAMQRMGLSQQKAQANIWLVGRNGLLFEGSSHLKALQAPYARPCEERTQYHRAQPVDLHAVVRVVNPTLLIGCSGSKGIFSKAIVTAMAEGTQRPIILPLSNPTECSEATGEDILRWTQSRALVATGSPFHAVNSEGLYFAVAQCNNALAFPGIGLGVKASQAKFLTKDILWEAALALSAATPASANLLLPEVEAIQEVTKSIAYKVYRLVKRQKGEACTEDEIIKGMERCYWKQLIEKDTLDAY